MDWEFEPLLPKFSSRQEMLDILDSTETELNVTLDCAYTEYLLIPYQFLVKAGGLHFTARVQGCAKLIRRNWNELSFVLRSRCLENFSDHIRTETFEQKGEIELECSDDIYTEFSLLAFQHAQSVGKGLIRFAKKINGAAADVEVTPQPRSEL